ncbi:hypothetical protein CHH83_02090 [Bacillus sp. 7586-K]|nr:hypothetical protein CHH83_02090 [Bacillus sp. 7586-K]
MKTMPYTLKQKLRQYDKYNRKARQAHDEVVKMLNQYGVPYDNLVAMNDNLIDDEPDTEALAYISYCEGDLEDNISRIEEVFLYFVNKSNS